MTGPTTKTQICHHPNLVPTQWDQPRPKPKEMSSCRCGENASCDICGWGYGSFPCSCEREDMKALQQLSAESFWRMEEEFSD